MHSRLTIIVALSILFSTGCKRAASDIEPSDTGPKTQDLQLARGISVKTVDFHQGIEIPLFEDGNAVDTTKRPMDALAGRDAMVRVFLKRDDEWEDRDLRAVFSMVTGGETHTQEIEAFVDTDSKQKTLNTTFNFDWQNDQIGMDTTWSVAIHETELDVDYAGSDEFAQYPTDGSKRDLDAVETDEITLLVIPVKYKADGSNRLPDTSDEQMKNLKKLMYSMYPVTKVNIEVDDPLPWDKTIEADGSGWNQLLTYVTTRRQTSNVDPQTYFYAMFNPEPTFNQFCAYGCVLGLSVLGGPQDEWSRASIGIGYSGNTTIDTVAHEVGHAHGREHAPCGLYGQPSDPNYPYSAGNIGVWGYDISKNKLKDPAYADVMSYCSPFWVSDYTFSGIHSRVQKVAKQRRAAPGISATWQRLSVDGDGVATSIDTLELTNIPNGEPTLVELFDKHGSKIDETTGYFYPFSHLPGGWVFCAKEHPLAVSARIHPR